MPNDKVLVVDDDPGLQEVLRPLLEKAGYSVSLLSDGNSIVRGEIELPDIFLLDKQLSGVDGLDICRFLKTSDESLQIPVVMMSAAPHVQRLSAEAGADDFLEKPFSTPALLAALARQIERPFHLSE